MALAPLPTSKMSAQEKKASVLPYPAFEAGRSPLTQQNKGQISPLMPALSQQAMPQAEHVQTQPSSQLTNAAPSNQPSPEELRMKELENMLNEAQSRAAVVEQEAYDKAYAAGEKAGLVLGEKRAEQILEAMDALVVQADNQLKLLQNDAESAVLDVAQAIAEHVIGDLGEQAEAALTLAVTQAVQQFSAEHLDLDNLMLAVHPDDMAAMSRMGEMHSDWRIRADKSVAVGTCRLLSAQQDALIDPKQAIAKAVNHIRGQLLSHG